MDLFKAHLAALLSIYEAGPPNEGNRTIPVYEGHVDWQTSEILRSLDVLAKRMWSAEETVSQLKANQNQSQQKANENVAANEHVDKAIDNPNHPDMQKCPTCGAYLLEELIVVPPGGPVFPPMLPQNQEELATTEELRLLKAQISDVARVCNAVAQGDLTQRITVPAHGTVMPQLKDVVNTMVDKLGLFVYDTGHSVDSFLDGTAGFCCGTLPRKYEPVWPELTGKIHKLLSTFTMEVRVMAAFIVAVSRGDMTQKIKLDVEGEILSLNNAAHDMAWWFTQLDKELKRAVEEVETFGKLKTPAHVEHMGGIWLDVLNNFNRICSLLPDNSKTSEDAKESQNLQKVAI